MARCLNHSQAVAAQRGAVQRTAVSPGSHPATRAPSITFALGALYRAQPASPYALLADREGTRAMGMLVCRGLSFAPQAWHHGEGLLPPPGHAPSPTTGSGCCPGTPTGRESGLHPTAAMAGCTGQGAGVNHHCATLQHVLPCTALICPTLIPWEPEQRATEDSKARASFARGGFGLLWGSPCLF